MLYIQSKHPVFVYAACSGSFQEADGDTKDLKNPPSPIVSSHRLAHRQTLPSMTRFKILRSHQLLHLKYSSFLITDSLLHAYPKKYSKLQTAHCSSPNFDQNFSQENCNIRLVLEPDCLCSSRCVTLGKFLILSMCQLPHLQDEDNSSNLSHELWQGRNELITVKFAVKLVIYKGQLLLS